MKKTSDRLLWDLKPEYNRNLFFYDSRSTKYELSKNYTVCKLCQATNKYYGKTTNMRNRVTCFTWSERKRQKITSIYQWKIKTKKALGLSLVHCVCVWWIYIYVNHEKMRHWINRMNWITASELELNQQVPGDSHTSYQPSLNLLFLSNLQKPNRINYLLALFVSDRKTIHILKTRERTDLFYLLPQTYQYQHHQMNQVFLAKISTAASKTGAVSNKLVHLLLKLTWGKPLCPIWKDLLMM